VHSATSEPGPFSTFVRVPRLTRVLLCLLAIAGAAAAAPSTAAARLPLKAIWGPHVMPDGSSAFPVYRQLGVDVLEMQLVWKRVAPRRPADAKDPDDPAYVWPENVDEAVRAAHRNGVQVALLVRGAPRWANGGRAPRWVLGAEKPYARFLIAASRRYRSVRRWMIWGEPNQRSRFGPMPPNSPRAPRLYARLLDRAYGALKRENRHNIVVGGMSFSFGEIYPRDWLRWMRLPNGKPPRLDEYGHNPFSGRAPDISLGGYPGFPAARDISDLDRFAREIRQTYRAIGRSPRIWISEFTVSSDRPDRAFNFAVSRAEQARWLRDGFGIARRVGAAGYGWFNLLDEPASTPRGLTTGLMTYEGEHKPSFRAYQRLP
jgi:hypothetical protein